MASDDDDDFSCVCCLTNVLKIASSLKEESGLKWYQCSEGHVFCENCYNLIGRETANCSVCGVLMRKIRNRFAENLFKKMVAESRCGTANRRVHQSTSCGQSPRRNKGERPQNDNVQIAHSGRDRQAHIPVKNAGMRKWVPQRLYDFCSSISWGRTFKNCMAVTLALVLLWSPPLGGVIESHGVQNVRKDTTPVKLNTVLQSEDPLFPPENVNGFEVNSIAGANFEGSKRDIIQLLQLAQRGNADVQYNIGEMLTSGTENSSPNPAQAFHFFVLAAKQGHAASQYRAGEYLESGVPPIAQDESRALAYYRKAAQQGFPKAQVAMGRFVKDGLAGVTASAQAARKYFQLAADQGDALGQYHLARSVQDAQPAQAVKYMRMAAEQGLDKAQEALGLWYATGRGVPQDYRAAAAQYRRAAEQGLAEAQLRMGIFYCQGLGGLPVDMEQGARYLELSAAQGLRQAQFALGLLHEEGTGGAVRPDRRRALRWILAAAEQGLADAEFVVGSYHERGLAGLQPDPARAGEWYRRAALQGNKPAVAALQRLGRAVS